MLLLPWLLWEQLEIGQEAGRRHTLLQNLMQRRIRKKLSWQRCQKYVQSISRQSLRNSDDNPGNFSGAFLRGKKSAGIYKITGLSVLDKIE